MKIGHNVIHEIKQIMVILKIVHIHLDLIIVSVHSFS